jgi:hypothetical protein
VVDVRASPFQRTRRSAELMFGHVVIDSALYGMGAAKDEQIRKLLSEEVHGGGNRALNTHQGVLYRILRLPQGSIAEGDCVIVKPAATRFDLIAQVRAADWK